MCSSWLNSMKPLRGFGLYVLPFSIDMNALKGNINSKISNKQILNILPMMIFMLIENRYQRHSLPLGHSYQ